MTRDSNEIRRQFIDYFVSRHGHTFVPSSSLVPEGDPTLLFVNSGMVQFKDVFLGTGRRPYQRAANSQKCLRVSGKHNDLEDVGRDTYHHTFFEMLGFWSFGDYFKREAIGWLWELLTGVWGLPKNRLYATVFAGDPDDGTDRDDEAADLWTEVTDIDPDHIQFWGKKDNFWEMADTGPCGPTSEIHIDLTPDGSGGELVNRDDPSVIELGNIVFMQFNRDTTGKLSPLPNRHVDFGGGFERLVAVLQGKTSNYESDLFTTIFDALRELGGLRPYAGERLDDPVDVAYRVVADHLRCLVFAITDGVVPSNEGRGYVLRRILRRAVRHGRQTLGISDPFLHRLVPPLVDLMGGAFPELTKDPDRLAGVIREEEEGFARTLDRGIALFEQSASRVEAAGERTIPAADAFRLYDTYGFPVDLTQVMAEERGMDVDLAGFSELMDEARELSRAAAGKTDELASLLDVVQHEVLPGTEFLGYAETRSEVRTWCRVCRLDGDRYVQADTAAVRTPVAIGLGATPFYAEAGGQVGDTGFLETDGARVRVQDAQSIGGVHFHIGEVVSGEISSGDGRFVLEVDAPRRADILGNHTGTHMMNLALRRVLGPHVEQKGSLVDPQKLRFDLSHPKPVAAEELDRIEGRVNADIGRNLLVYDAIVPLADAYSIRNLRAVFGEKYAADVRVVSIGVPVDRLLAEPDNPGWDDVSIELCGGTHLRTSADAEDFVIVSEEAVAKGIRRIVALTKGAARQARSRGDEVSKAVEEAEGGPDERLEERLAELVPTVNDTSLPLLARNELRARVEQLQRRAREVAKQQTAAAAESALSDALAAIESADDPVVVAEIPGVDADALRKAVEDLRSRKQDVAVLLGSVSDGKVAIVAAVPKPILERGLKAGDWVREAAAAAGGRGGGRPDIAQAGARDADKLPAALEAARRYASEMLGG